MPPDWDDDSPELRENLAKLLESVEENARLRLKPTVEAARHWQSDMMRGLRVEPGYVGAFRGEPGLDWVQVQVGGHYGVASDRVSGALRDFERRLQSAVAYFDGSIPPDPEPDADRVGTIVCRQAMLGDWEPTVALFGELLRDFLEKSDPDV